MKSFDLGVKYASPFTCRSEYLRFWSLMLAGVSSLLGRLYC